MPGEDPPPTDSATRRLPPECARVFQYKAFLSYNQRADSVLASALERGLEQFSKKWYQRRAFDVFRDATSLSANSALWPTLQASLDRTEYYILIASPESAASNWVPKELTHWLTHRGHRNVLFVLTHGEILWDETAIEFDWSRTTGLNEQALKAKFDAQPLWVDCRWARGLDDAAIRRDARFPDAVASIASTLHGRSKSELFGEDLRQHRRQMRLAQVAVASLAFLLLLALVFWRQSHERGNELVIVNGDLSVSLKNETEARIRENAARKQEEIARKDAEAKARIANSRRLAALSATGRDKRLDRALLLAVEAFRAENTFEARDNLFKAIQDRPHVTSMLHETDHMISSVAVSLDGKTIAAGYDGGVVAWDAAGRGRLMEGRFNWKGVVSCVAVSPDGNTLASGLNARDPRSNAPTAGVMLWSIADAKLQAALPLEVEGGDVQGVAFSPDGKTFAAGYRTGDGAGVVVWDAADRKRRSKGSFATDGPVGCLAFSPDGKILAAGSNGANSGVVLWDTVSHARLAGYQLTSQEGSVRSLAFGPDGRTLAAGVGLAVGLELPVGGVVLWDLAGRTRLTEVALAVREGVVSNVAFSRDGRMVAAGYLNSRGPDGVVLWDVAGRRRLTEDPIVVKEGSVSSLAFGRDGTTIAVGSGGGAVVLCAVFEHQWLTKQTLDVKEGIIESVAFSPDGKTIAAGYRDVGVGAVGVAKWDAAGGTRLAEGALIADAAESQRLANGPLVVKEGDVQSVAFSPDGKTVATGYRSAGGGGGGVVLWDAIARNRLTETPLAAKEGEVVSLAFSPDGKTIAAGYSAGNGSDGVVLWDVNGRKRLAEDPLPVRGEVNSVVFSPNGVRIAAGYRHGGAVVWDAATRVRLMDDPFAIQEGWNLTCVAFSPDGKTVVAGTHYNLGSFGGVVVLWDVDLESWQRIAGRIANRNFTRDEWRVYFPEELYRRTFRNLPWPSSLPKEVRTKAEQWEREHPLSE